MTRPNDGAYDKGMITHIVTINPFLLPQADEKGDALHTPLPVAAQSMDCNDPNIR